MPSLFDKFSLRRQAVKLDDNEKAQQYESEPTRLSKSSPPGSPQHEARGATTSRRSRGTATSPKGHYAPHPAVLKYLRFLMYAITSASSLATAGVGLAVVHYYNTHGPVIKPSWGSLIAVIVFGIGTPGVLFGLMIVIPFLVRPHSFLGILIQTRMEFLMLFGMAAVWISGALAVACDLRGRENCLWDGYYHYQKPANFDNVCELINITVALAYTTFGLCAFQLVIFTTWLAYIMLYLDQEALTERTNDLGGRAYRARQATLTRRRTLKRPSMSEKRHSPRLSPRVPVPPLEMAPSNEVPSSRIAPPPITTGYRDVEDGAPGVERSEEEGQENEAYYGYDANARRRDNV